MQENKKIITDGNFSTMPILAMPKLVFPTSDNYGTGRFRLNEVIVCKDVAFVITFISSKKLSLKLIDKRFADAVTGKQGASL